MKTFTLTYGAGHQVLINVPAERIIAHFENLQWSGFRVVECGSPDLPIPADEWLGHQFALPLRVFIYTRARPTVHIGVLAPGPPSTSACWRPARATSLHAVGSRSAGPVVTTAGPPRTSNPTSVRPASTGLRRTASTSTTSTNNPTS